MKIKIGIWGSCLTRDIFRSIFNNYKEYFEIISSLERVSLVSLMGDEHSIEFIDEEDLERIFSLLSTESMMETEEPEDLQ